MRHGSGFDYKTYIEYSLKKDYVCLSESMQLYSILSVNSLYRK